MNNWTVICTLFVLSLSASSVEAKSQENAQQEKAKNEVIECLYDQNRDSVIRSQEVVQLSPEECELLNGIPLNELES